MAKFPSDFNITGHDNMSAFKETMDLMQAYHRDMDQMGLDAILMHAAMHPAPVKACCSLWAPVKACRSLY